MRKSRVSLQIQNLDTEEIEKFRDRVTRRTYFIFIAAPLNKKKPKLGILSEFGFRYDDLDKNTFLFSSVLGIYFRWLVLF